jgi:hypothetical protein
VRHFLAKAGRLEGEFFHLAGHGQPVEAEFFHVAGHGQPVAEPVRIPDMKPIYDRLVELARLDEDWDGNNGVPPSGLAVAEASRLIGLVLQSLSQSVGRKAAPYSLMPIADGGLVIEWRVDSMSVHIDVSGDGHVGYVVDDKRGDERAFNEGDDITLEAAIEIIARVVGK